MSEKKSNKLLTTLIIIGIVLVLIVALFIGNYNKLVSAKADVETKQSSISTQLQRRSDLIPNLVNTVKGYAAHEQQVYTDIANARSKLSGANSVDEMANANEQLTAAVNRLIAIAEAYPELKANQNFIALQDELAGTENRITTARNDYNNAAKSYNLAVTRFPGNIFAGIYGFEKVEYFTATEGSEKVPSVSFE